MPDRLTEAGTLGTEGRPMTLAHRTRTARRNGACPLCRAPVRIGQQIAMLGRTWVHTTCAVARM